MFSREHAKWLLWRPRFWNKKIRWSLWLQRCIQNEHIFSVLCSSSHFNGYVIDLLHLISAFMLILIRIYLVMYLYVYRSNENYNSFTASLLHATLHLDQINERRLDFLLLFDIITNFWKCASWVLNDNSGSIVSGMHTINDRLFVDILR